VIARIEIDAMLCEVLGRMKGLHLDGEVKWLASNFISGPTEMPVRFEPGPRVAD
jgi:cytochrome P450